MKQFFKYLFASLSAMILFFLLLIVVFIGIIAGSAGSEKTSIEKNSVFMIDLNDPIAEQGKVNQLAVLSGDAGKVVGLNQLLTSIRQAKTDDKIKGIYLKLGISVNGWATLQEVRDALQDFKSSKKFIYAYGEIADQKSMYMSAVSDSTFINPAGGVEFKGLAIASMFFKGTLDKLDVHPIAFHCGKYKSAHEPYSRENYSDANKQQLLDLLTDFNVEFLQALSQKSKTDTAILRIMPDNKPNILPREAVALRLIDKLAYSDEVEQTIKRKLSLKETDKISFVTADEYADAAPEKNADAKDKIAILYAEGAIYDGDGNEEIFSKTITKSIRKIKNDESIKGVILRVNSPGGSALASEVIYHELAALHAKKPMVVSMGNYAASGGYYISCAADSIFADRNTLTGSIGVVGVLFNVADMYKNKLGITTDAVKTNTYADFPNLTRKMEDVEVNWIQSYLDTTYNLFKKRVADARRMSLDQVEELAQGHVYSGKKALQLGLIDGLGNVDRALQSIEALTKIKTYKIVEYPKPVDQITELMNQLSGKKREEAMAKKILGDDYVVYKEIQKIKSQQNQIQAALPWLIDIK